MQITAKEIASYVQGEVSGDSKVLIHAPARIEEASEGTFSFLANMKYEAFVYETKASVLLVEKSFIPTEPLDLTLIKVDDVYGALAILLDKFGKDLESEAKQGLASTVIINGQTIIHPTASIDDYCILEDGVEIGENVKIFGHVYIAKQSKIGANTIIYPGAKLYSNTIIGERCIIHSNVVLGSDGFGFSKTADNTYKKIPQIGNVVLGDDVEIGANSVIDRATMGSTIIEKGVKLDNLIHMAHNVIIGKNTVVAAQTGFSGSVKIAEECMIGGQAGFAGHISVEKGAIILGRSGVTKSIRKENVQVFGSPAINRKLYMKSYAIFKMLPNLFKLIKGLEKQIKALQEKTTK